MSSISQRIIAFLCLGLLLSGCKPDVAMARANQQTIPTRTPTPLPTNPPSGGGGSGNPAPPVDTATPTVPPTPTAGQVFAPTPSGGVTTPQPCGEPLFLASLGTINVRRAPDTVAPVMGQLVYLEARGIIGRYAADAWWLIALADQTQGWVTDEAGQSFGYLSPVPVLDADGQPTSEAAMWQPTGETACPTPTATPITPTAKATSTTNVAPSTSEVTPIATTNGVSDDNSTTTAQPTRYVPVPTAFVPALATEFSPTADSTNNASPPNWGLMGGFGLILLGILVGLVQRVRGKNGL